LRTLTAVRRGPVTTSASLLVACALLLVAACTVETQDDAASTTTVPPTTAPASTTTLPPELQPPDLQDVSAQLDLVANYTVPLRLIGTRPGSDSLFVGDRLGRIYEVKRDARRNPQTGFVSYTVRPLTSPFLDISAQVSTEGEDWGLHGFAFSTDGARLYVAYTNRDGQTATNEFRVSGGRVSPTSQRDLLAPIENRDRTHNAGPIAIGADGFLHLTLGDGGGEGDPFENAQDPTRLQGKVLRIDPETRGEPAYNIPLGNPFREQPIGREVYQLGLRDPASIWFDPVTRALWLTDTGEDGVQEVNVVPWEGAPPDGGNFGWPLMNGVDEFEGEAPDDHIEPIFVYGPEQGCQIVGGVVYHGDAIPGLGDAYVFGDRCTGRILAFTLDDGAIDDYRILPFSVPENTLAAIGTDPQGEIWVLTNSTDSASEVHQLVYLPPAIDPATGLPITPAP
jgi:glucose/arabinose dehydrogenase